MHQNSIFYQLKLYSTLVFKNKDLRIFLMIPHWGNCSVPAAAYVSKEKNLNGKKRKNIIYMYTCGNREICCWIGLRDEQLWVIWFLAASWAVNKILYYSCVFVLQQHTKIHTPSLKHWQGFWADFGMHLLRPFLPKPVGRQVVFDLWKRRSGNSSGCMKESKRGSKLELKHILLFFWVPALFW